MYIEAGACFCTMSMHTLWASKKQRKSGFARRPCHGPKPLLLVHVDQMPLSLNPIHGRKPSPPTLHAPTTSNPSKNADQLFGIRSECPSSQPPAAGQPSQLPMDIFCCLPFIVTVSLLRCQQDPGRWVKPRRCSFRPAVASCRMRLGRSGAENGGPVHSARQGRRSHRAQLSGRLTGLPLGRVDSQLFKPNWHIASRTSSHIHVDLSR